jgi:hypothetical protein
LDKVPHSRSLSLKSNASKKGLDKNKPDADLLEYILSAGMLGDLAAGNIQEAGLLWGKYGPLLPVKNAQSITMRLLVTRLSSSGQGNLSDLHNLH